MPSAKNPRPKGQRLPAKPPPGVKPTGRGGAYRNQGRKPGVSKAKKPSYEAATRIAQGLLLINENGGVLPRAATPLDVMVEAMRVAYRLGGALAAFPYAKEAAPYVHAKISSITLTPPAPEHPDGAQGDLPLVEFVNPDEQDPEVREMLGLPPLPAPEEPK